MTKKNRAILADINYLRRMGKSWIEIGKKYGKNKHGIRFLYTNLVEEARDSED